VFLACKPSSVCPFPPSSLMITHLNLKRVLTSRSTKLHPLHFIRVPAWSTHCETGCSHQHTHWALLRSYSLLQSHNTW
jgi:hypothetical protein